MATTYTSTAETSTSDYLMPDDSQELFQNITTFAKNMTVKDSELYEDAESSTSKWLGSLLVKYYEHTLTIDDIRNLLMFVGTYNKVISDKTSSIEKSLLSLTSSTSEECSTDCKLFFLKLLGMYNSQAYSNSFINLLAEGFIADNYDEHPEWVDKKLFISYIFFCLMFDYDNLYVNDYIHYFDSTFEMLATTTSTSARDEFYGLVSVSGLDSITVKKTTDDDGNESYTSKISIDNSNITRSTIIEKVFNQFYGLVFSILFKMAYDKGGITLVDGYVDGDYFLNVLSASNYPFIGSDSGSKYLIRNKVTNNKIESQILSSGTSTSTDSLSSNLDYLASLVFMREIVSIDEESNTIDLIDSDFSDTYLTIFQAVLEYVRNNRSDLIEVILNLIGKEKFIMYQTSYGSDSYGSTSKLTASEYERKYASAGYATNFFDLRVPWDSVSDILTNTAGYYDFTTALYIGTSTVYSTDGSTVTTLPTKITELSDSGTSGMVGILIAYKELNTEYRNTLRADLLDYGLFVQRTNMRKVITVSSTAYTAVSSDAANYARKCSDDLVVVRDYRSSEDSSVLSTSKLFKYQYTNPYICRTSLESDCISYYISDPYISNRYGRYTYQETEINNFLILFKETRDFYYRVLLNESFTKESQYFLYEKSFIIFYTIERFLTSKLDNLKDVDSFDLTDTKNFLTSYGFESLVDILNLSSFYSSEDLSKRLIKYYTNLTSYKGARKVIDILQDVFSLPDGTLTIYKELLVKVKSDEGYEYKFIRTSEDNENLYEEIISGLSSAVTLSSFVEEDKYWNESNTSAALLSDVGLQWSNTKYIIPEVVAEISEVYTVTRCVFALVDYLFDTVEDFSSIIGDWSILENLIVEDEVNLQADYNVTMDVYIDGIRALFRTYLETKFSTESEYYKNWYNSIFDETEYTNENARKDVSFKVGSGYKRTYDSSAGEWVGEWTSDFKRERLEKLNLSQFYKVSLDAGSESYYITINEDCINGYFRGSTVSSSDGSCFVQPEQISYMLDALIPILIADGVLDDLVDSIYGEGGLVMSAVTSYLSSLPSTLSTNSSVFLNGLNSVLPKDNTTRSRILKTLKTHYGIDTTSSGNSIATLNAATLNSTSSVTSEYDMYENRKICIQSYFVVHEYTNSSNALTQDGFRYYVTDYFLHLPLMLVNGEAFDIAEFDAKGISFMRVLYEGIYLDNAENILYSEVMGSGSVVASSTYSDESTDTMANAIISMCSNLKSILYQSIQISLTESQNALISFLSEAISFFISYTTCIYDFYYMNSYESEGEALSMSDRLLGITKRASIDSVFYDEEVTVKIVKQK